MNKPPSIAGRRVLVLSKRQYMSRDLLSDRYGRFRELPLGLSRRGADVRGVCLSYRRRGHEVVRDEAEGAHVLWESVDLAGLADPSRRGYRGVLDQLRASFRPDLVWACSDAPHAVLGVWAARKFGCPLVVDLYDAFESYPLAKVPGVNAALRRAVRAANAVSCVSEPLARRVREDYRFAGPVSVIGNAVPEGRFVPADAAAARRSFGLPAGRRLLGTAGALSLARGTDVLLRAFDRLAAERDDVDLVLAGPLDPRLELPPASPRIHYLGLLPPDAVPRLLPALDVAVICNRDSEFGRYCFPQKLYEALACAVPVSVAAVGAMRDLLAGEPGCLYEPDDVDSLVAALRRQLDSPWVPMLPIPTWDSEAEGLAALMSQAATAAGRPT